MKAPLRFLFGWVIYIAIYAATFPVCRAIEAAISVTPIVVSIVAAIVAMVFFALLMFFGMRRLFRWCDAPRAHSK